MFKYLAALAVASLGPQVADGLNLEAQSLATTESKVMDLSYSRS